MPKHAAHATLERERTRSRIVDDEPAPPAALEECLGVLPLGDDDDLATFDLFRPDGVVSAIDVEGLPDEDAVALGCEAQAMAEGLTLVSSTNACGFKGVSYLGLKKDNRTRAKQAVPGEDQRPLRGELCDGSGGRAVLRAGDGRHRHRCQHRHHAPPLRAQRRTRPQSCRPRCTRWRSGTSSPTPSLPPPPPPRGLQRG